MICHLFAPSHYPDRYPLICVLAIWHLDTTFSKIENAKYHSEEIHMKKSLFCSVPIILFCVGYFVLYRLIIDGQYLIRAPGNETTLVQVMTWCPQTTCHYLQQWCHHLAPLFKCKWANDASYFSDRHIPWKQGSWGVGHTNLGKSTVNIQCITHGATCNKLWKGLSPDILVMFWPCFRRVEYGLWINDIYSYTRCPYRFTLSIYSAG